MLGLGISRKFINGVVVGDGTIAIYIDPPPQEPLGDFCFIDGFPMAIAGQLITPHTPCPLDPLHCTAVGIATTITTFVQGIPVIRELDPASCLHPSIGSKIVFST